MHKKLLLIGLMFTSVIAFAQFEVRTTSTDELVADGQTISFSESGSSSSEDYNWKFKVTNTSDQDIYMRIFVDNLTNTDGSNFQLCFAGVCLFSVNQGTGYPSTAALIEPGQTNVAGNSLWNQHPSGTSTPMSWTFRYQAFDAVGGNEIGSPVTITYNYEPNLSIDESELSSVKVFPTQVENELNISSNEELTAEFYTILGKKVKQNVVASGESTIDVSGLSSQLYIVRFTNKAGKTLVKKIVVE